MSKTTPKTALITGASSGFGYELARLFAKDGYNLVLVSLHNEKLKDVAKEMTETYDVHVDYTECDLSVPGSAQQLYDWTKKRKLTVDCLVNNAGIGIYGRFIDHELSKEQALMQLNMNTLAELCHLYIADMVKQGDGKVLNVASIAAFEAGPFYATYFASKAFVLLLSEALYYEYVDRGVTVTAVCPGVSRTGFFKQAGMRDDSKLLQSYMMTAEQVAKIGYSAMQAGKRMVVPGTRNKFVALGYRVFPRSILNRITYRLVHRTAE